MEIEETRKLIKKFAVKNAIDYGKADAGSVLGKIIPSAKGVPVPELRKEVEAIVSKINKMSKKELEKEYKPFEKEFAKKAQDTVRKTEKPKMRLEGAVEREFATRWPPEPSGYQHIGHAKPIFLEDEFRKMYDGKYFLYFDDTNPEKEKQEYVDADKADLSWLGIKFDKEYYASDNLGNIYECAKKLIDKGHAYVCHCDQETIKKMRQEMKGCEHRDRSPKANLTEFEKMLSGKYNDGEAVLRFKGKMNSQNTVMRDPTLARIKKAKHYRQGTKYCVWPTYDLAAPINDSVNGVTDIMRSKEYELRDELNIRILETLGLRIPRIHQFSRLNIKGNTTHKREIRELIAKGAISGWDDPRLMTFLGLKRRGIVPEAIRQFALKAGMTKNDSELPLEALLAENRKVVDPVAKHLFFVHDPVMLKVDGEKGAMAKLRLHPLNDYGYREYNCGDTFFIDGSDAEMAKKNGVLRLKDLMLLKVKSVGKGLITATKLKPELREAQTVQWVSKDNCTKCSVVIPGELLNENGAVNPDSLKSVTGLVEKYAEKLDNHEIVQFERFGYCILDNKKKMGFILISK